MCIECWWDCLNVIQQIGVVIIGAILAVLWFVWGQLVLEMCFARPRTWPEGIDWLAPILPVMLLIAFVGAIIYGFYGMIACLF